MNRLIPVIFLLSASITIFSCDNSGAGSKTQSVSFSDVTAEAGINYTRTESPRGLIFDAQKQQPQYTMADLPFTPGKTHGAPGIALFDYDNDGDIDVYVSNGPGTANSLFQNQLSNSGSANFVDIGEQAGVAATLQDSNGVCAADIDNDGDKDLLVLGSNEPNILYSNNGDGTFSDITVASGISLDNRGHASCSMGDVDNDGLLDIVIANTWDNWENQLPIFVEAYALNDHNQLFINAGSGNFVDNSIASGFNNTSGFNPAADGSATVTWGIALVDVDLDGDLDIIHADDQAAIPHLGQGGVNRGVLHIFNNDGTGNFTDISEAAGINKQGAWMGLAFGDLNCDGNMDIFASNVGDYMFPLLDPGYVLGQTSARWFLGAQNGTYSDPGVGDLIATPFGWGNSIVDYDNDGDQDIIYHGGLDVGPFIDAGNPGAILKNIQCSGKFVNETSVAGSSTNHLRRNVQGVAVGDLNNDGFSDVVTVSNLNSPEPIPLVPYPVTYGSTFDGGGFIPTFTPTGPGTFVYSGIEVTDGDLSVEINSADNGNGWLKIDTRGTSGITSIGKVNRDGIGSVVFVTPANANTTLKPVVAGNSYASTHSKVLGFGLGSASEAQVEVLWPGGVRNRLYNVQANQTIVLPEIPCSYDDQNATYDEHVQCVTEALTEINQAGMIDDTQSYQLLSSAITAWFDTH